LGATYDVGTMYVWNGESNIPTRGVKTADIYYSLNENADASDFASGDWTLLHEDEEFTIIPGAGNNTPDITPQEIDMVGVTARVIALNITADQGQSGGSLNELQFLGTVVSAGSGLAPAPAAPDDAVTWQTPTSIYTLGDATVLTTGTLVEAVSYGSDEGNHLVNGVNFIWGGAAAAAGLSR
jgi:hypothetical protein